MTQARHQGMGQGLAWGYSLIEAMVVLLLLAVLLGLTVPAVAHWRARQSVQALAEEVWRSLTLARSQAMRVQQRVVLCPRTSDNTCNVQGLWPQGWLVFVDSNHDGQHDPQELIVQVREALPVGLVLQGNATVGRGVRYGPDGLGDGLGGTLNVCRPDVAEGWKIVVNALGRPRLERTELTSCP